AVRDADGSPLPKPAAALVSHGFEMAHALRYQGHRYPKDAPVLQADEILELREGFDTERMASERSFRGLDWLNFFKADAQTRVGPYLAIFLLAARHWDLAKIGMA